MTTTIIPDSPTQDVKVLAQSINALLVDDVHLLNWGLISRQESKAFDAYRYWRTAGFANVLSMAFLEITVRVNKGEDPPKKFEVGKNLNPSFLDVVSPRSFLLTHGRRASAFYDLLISSLITHSLN